MGSKRRPEDNTSETNKKPKSTKVCSPKVHMTSSLDSTVSEQGHTTSKSDRQYFLMKQEPEELSITDLGKKLTEEWSGIRNYEARNILRSMNTGDLCFFYHSSCKEPGIVGVMSVIRTHRPDDTALDPSKGPGYYDPKCTLSNNKWSSVLVKFEREYPSGGVTLKELREEAAKNPQGPIASLDLLRRSRLSITRISWEQWNSVEMMLERKLKYLT